MAIIRRFFLLLVLCALLPLVAGCPGESPGPPVDEAQKFVDEFLTKVKTGDFAGALQHVAPSERERVKAMLDGFRDKAVAFILSRPGVDELQRADMPPRMRDRFDMFGIVKEARAQSSVKTGPGEFAVPATLIVPGLYMISRFNQEEPVLTRNFGTERISDPELELVVLPVTIPVRQSGGTDAADGEAAVTYEVMDLPLERMLEPTAMPNNLVHRFYELCATNELGDPLMELFVPEIREQVKIVLRKWNELNTLVLKDDIIPRMESMRESLLKDKKPTDDLDTRLESARQHLQFLPNWPVWIVDHYTVQGTTFLVQDGETLTTARLAEVESQASMRSFMPHRLNRQMMFEPQPSLQKVRIRCKRMADNSWLIVNNPFDMTVALKEAMQRAAEGRTPQ